MIPSINALKTVALSLRKDEYEFRINAHVARTIKRDDQTASNVASLADDYNQVAQMIEEQIVARTTTNA